MMKRCIFFLLKVTITATLLWVASRNIDFGLVKQKILDAHVGLFVLGVAVLIFTVLTSARRWQLILAASDRLFVFRRLASHTFSGSFFNQLLPSSIGGDLVRAWLIYRDGVPLPLAIQSVILERIMGLLSLLIFTAVTLPLLLQAFGFETSHIWAIGAVFFATSIALGLMLVLIGIGYFRLGESMRLVAVPMTALELNLNFFVWQLGLSLFGQVLGCVSVYIFSQAVYHPLNFIDILVVMPAMFLLMAIPISLAGWGVRESVMVLGLSAFGTDASTAILISVMFGTANALIGFAAGGYWLLTCNFANKISSLINIKEVLQARDSIDPHHRQIHIRTQPNDERPLV